MQSALQKHLFNINDYYRMADSGIFAEDAHLELINGEIIDMALTGSKHAGIVSFLARSLTLQLGEQAIVRVQDPIHLGDLSAPQPDLAIVKPRVDFYREQHPRADDVLLLIEVSDSSIQYDLKSKIPLYAKYGIAECWLVNLNDNSITQYNDPFEGNYKTKKIHHANDLIISAQLERIQVKLASMLA